MLKCKQKVTKYNKSKLIDTNKYTKNKNYA